uniref:Branched-chain-amino-acid aminotransferase n=1 Tax=Kalanchoe fedtschenkoi TaxID=63787 RepID=A0A7N0ZQ41_KALFE
MIRAALRLRNPTKPLSRRLPLAQKNGACRFGSSQAASSALTNDVNEAEYADVDWDSLGFSLKPAGYMYAMKCARGGAFEKGEICPYGDIGISPAAGVLNYGQAIYEGTIAQRRQDGRVLLFRPELNANRMRMGAERMCMPSPSVDQFVDALKRIAQSNKRWVPPPGKGSLYIRPLLMGSGAILGLGPAPEYTFVVYASPAGNYFKERSASLNLYIEDEFHRSGRGGTGGVKSITNYGPVLKPLTRAKSMGFSEVLYLDSVEKKYIEELSACNIFIAKGNVISTPAATGMILEGVTRKSIIELARLSNYKVEERSIAIDELFDTDEVFCTGTAVGVADVGSITYKDKRIEYKTGANSVCGELGAMLAGIKNGVTEDKLGWTVEID